MESIHTTESSIGEGWLPKHAQHEQPEVNTKTKDNSWMPTVNPYHILQVRRDATTAEIQQSYRRLALLNHPGRGNLGADQKTRKLQMFEILAACYETLIDEEARRRVDAHLSVVENQRFNRGLAGDLFVGGKLIGRRALPVVAANNELEILPQLVRSDSLSSSSSTSSSDVPSSPLFITSTTSVKKVAPTRARDSSETTEKQVSEAETENLFGGGPLSDLFRARNFKPFGDSFDVFEKVFGSQVFEVSREEMGSLRTWEPIRDLATPAGWQGSSRRSEDGKTFVFTTSRILHDRRVTRIETITEDALTRRRHKHTTVLSQPLEQSDLKPDETGSLFGACATSENDAERAAEEEASCYSFQCTGVNFLLVWLVVSASCPSCVEHVERYAWSL
eukprot:scaffold3840_cov129-Cylindrotheca_fusiformis.AAC.13